MAWLCLVIFLDHCTMSFMEKKYEMPLPLVCNSQDWYQNITKKLNKHFHNFFVCCKVAKMGEKVFFSKSENHFLHIPADILVSFPDILLFWSLSLLPVWLNIEGRQDFRYKTPILFFYSENNSDSLNHPPNTNLPIV